MSTSAEGSVNGKKRRAEAHLHVLDLEERRAELLQTHFMWRDVGLPVDDEALDLVEHRRVGLVGVVPVGAARDDDPDRRRLRPHGADLHRRGVGAQHLALAALVGREEEGVVHLPRRMADGEVQRREVELVGLDVRPFGDREAHVGEDRGELVDDLGDRVDAAARLRPLRHRQA